LTAQMASQAKVLVFGAAGQVGRAVVRNLRAAPNTSVIAFERNPESWRSWEQTDGPLHTDVKTTYGDISKFDVVEAAVAGCTHIVHTAVYFPPSVNTVMPDYALDGRPPDHDAGSRDEDDVAIWTVNLKGMWNVLEAARRHNVQKVVHIGSCHVAHPGSTSSPDGEFYNADIRRPDGSIYAVSKRLQEEMCRRYYEAFGSKIIVLRPDYIVDGELGIGRFGEQLPGDVCPDDGWVCRHDLAEAARLSLMGGPDFDVLHTVTDTAAGKPDAARTCNVERTREVLGWNPTTDLSQFRK